MICPKCGFDCPPDFDFCPKCATALAAPVVASLSDMAVLCLRAGQPHRAAELLGLALQRPASTSEVARYARPVLEALHAELGPEELEAALARGAEMDLDEVVEQILAEGYCATA